MQSGQPPERESHLLKVTEQAKQWSAGQGSRKWRIKPERGVGFSQGGRGGPGWGWQVSGVETSRRLTCGGQHYSCSLSAMRPL